VFVTETVAELMGYLGLQIFAVEPLWPLHIVAIAQKVPAGHSPDNRRFLGDRAAYRHRSPFRSDRGAAAYATAQDSH
jgi:hypothetical protein